MIHIKHEKINEEVYSDGTKVEFFKAENMVIRRQTIKGKVISLGIKDSVVSNISICIRFLDKKQQLAVFEHAKQIKAIMGGVS